MKEIEDLCVAKDAHLRTATVSNDKTLKIYDFTSNKVTHLLEEDSPLISLDWSHTDQNYLAYGSETGEWILKDIRMFESTLRREVYGKDCPVRKIAFAPYEDSSVLGIGADHLYFYNVQSGDPVWQLCNSRPLLRASPGRVHGGRLQLELAPALLDGVG